jgi:hypothetical protein
MKISMLLLSLGLATAAVAQMQPPTPPPYSQPPPPPAAAPPTAQPIEPPPGEITAPPPPPSASVGGEWVYTNQYGWIWMPYDQQYTHVIQDSGTAYEFVYYPSFGWRWVVAPWVFGIGPRPHFVHGPVHFAWYAHPWFRSHPLVHREIHEHRR